MKYDENNPMNNNAMEKTIPFPSDISDDQKYLYGTYFEMGFHNFFMSEATSFLHAAKPHFICLSEELS